MADAEDSKSSVLYGRVGSSPTQASDFTPAVSSLPATVLSADSSTCQPPVLVLDVLQAPSCHSAHSPSYAPIPSRSFASSEPWRPWHVSFDSQPPLPASQPPLRPGGSRRSHPAERHHRRRCDRQ